MRVSQAVDRSARLGGLGCAGARTKRGMRPLTVVDFYMRSRTHLGLDKDSPMPRPVMRSTAGRIVAVPEVNGLHRRYDRAAA